MKCVGIRLICSPSFPSKERLGMASKDVVIADMRQRQDRKPTYWTLTMQQLRDVLIYCSTDSGYSRLKEQKRYVSMYDLNTLFVKPWSRGTGCGLSILMCKHVAESAQFMISHAWGEALLFHATRN